MALNIIDLIKGQLGPALISQAATQFGESESGISKAISGLLPAIVGGLANNADKPGVIDAITGAGSGGILGDLLGSTTNNSLITTVLTSIFGDKIGGIVNAISTFSGISNTSSSSILNMVTGATIGSVGKYAQDNNLGASGITSLLHDQKDVVSSLLPAGLSLASLGVGNMFGNHNTDKVKVTSFDQPTVEVNRAGETHVTSTPSNNEGGSIWKWLLPLILLGLAAWFLWNNYNKKPADESIITTDSTVVVSDSSANMVNDSASMNMPVREMTDIDLNGTMIKGYPNGMEASMINFLKSDSYKNAADDEALKNTWYNFDNVNFKMNSSTELEPGSAGQLQNLAAILKAYPDAKINIGGYTDKVGDATVNKDISQKRANYIKSELGKLGVANQIVDAKGYGSEFATVPAEASNDERAVDRKMAVRFTK